MRRSKSTRVTEHQIQTALFQWLRAVHPKVVAFAVPNAARRSPSQAAYLKAEGLRAGIPDVVLATPRGGFAGMFLELKREGGKLSDAQRETLYLLANEGYACAIAWNLDEAIELITQYLEGNWNELLNAHTTH